MAEAPNTREVIGRFDLEGAANCPTCQCKITAVDFEATMTLGELESDGSQVSVPADFSASLLRAVPCGHVIHDGTDA